MAATVTPLGVISVTGGLNAQDFKVRTGYLVTFDTPGSDNANNALYVQGVPQVPSYLFGYPGLIAVDHGSDLESGDDSTLNVRVWVEFATHAFVGNTTGQPWLRKDRVIGFDDAGYERAMTQDFSSPTPKPILNTAGDPPETPVMRTFINPLLRIGRSRLVTGFDMFAAKSCQDTLNLASFVIHRQYGDIVVPAKGAVLRHVGIAEQLWNDGTAYVDITLAFELKGQIDLEHLYMQNKGYRELVTVSGTPRTMICADPVQDPNNPGTYLKDNSGKNLMAPVNHPSFLKTDGTRLKDGVAPTAANGYTDLMFTHYPTADWSAWI